MVLHYYILVFGIIVVFMGLLEIIFPQWMLSFWVSWTTSKWFFLHGIILIAAGFPLTLVPHHNPLSTPLFIVGMIVVFSGPFILIYPEKIRNLFIQGLDELGQTGSRFALIVDAIARIAAGILCILAYILN